MFIEYNVSSKFKTHIYLNLENKLEEQTHSQVQKEQFKRRCDLICTYLDDLQLLQYFVGVDFNEEGEILTQKGLKICTYQIQELVLGALNQAVANKLLESIDILRESYTGTFVNSFMAIYLLTRPKP